MTTRRRARRGSPRACLLSGDVEPERHVGGVAPGDGVEVAALDGVEQGVAQRAVSDVVFETVALVHEEQCAFLPAVHGRPPVGPRTGCAGHCTRFQPIRQRSAPPDTTRVSRCWTHGASDCPAQVARQRARGPDLSVGSRLTSRGAGCEMRPRLCTITAGGGAGQRRLLEQGGPMERISRRTALALAAGVATNVVLAACGDDDDDTASTESAGSSSAPGTTEGAAPATTAAATTTAAPDTTTATTTAADEAVEDIPPLSDYDLDATMRFMWAAPPTRFDPHRATASFDAATLNQVYDRLVHLSPLGVADPRPGDGVGVRRDGRRAGHDAPRGRHVPRRHAVRRRGGQGEHRAGEDRRGLGRGERARRHRLGRGRRAPRDPHST